VLDRNSVFVASPNPAIVGEKFYGDKVQNTFFKNTGAVNALYGKILSGQRADAVFDVGYGERLVTGQPVIVNGKPAYFLTVGIPTKLTYDQIDAKLASQNNLNYAQWIFLLVAGSTLLLFLIRINNRLNKEVSNRTEALVVSNKQLADANEQLKIHSKMQTEFINVAAHELRTPIQPMMALVDLLKSRFESGEDGIAISTKQVEILDRNAKRLQRLSSEILDATRIEAGTLRLETEVLDINEKIRDAIADTASLIPRGKNMDINFYPIGISATKDAKPSYDSVPMLLVQADGLRMFEVISNLIRNAIKFSPREGGIITITTEKRDESILKEGGKVCPVAVVSVKDLGEGISPENRSRLFTKFSSDRERGGTGLGLYLAKNIIEAHGGKIWAENNKDEKGTTFTFILPLADGSADSTSEMPRAKVKS
jgi:signal transduction histidine kinase